MTRLVPGFLTRNLGLKALASLLAVVTWSGVVYAANPPGIRTIPVHVPQDPATLPPGFVLTQPIPDLTLRIAGTADHLAAFDASSLELHVHYEQIRSAGSLQLPIDVRNHDGNVEVDRAPTTVDVVADRLDTLTLPVEIQATPGPPPGYLKGTAVATPSSVTVTGPQHELADLKPTVSVDLSNQKANFEGEETLFLFDSRGRRVSDVNASPPTVRVLITIVAVSTQRVSAVVPPIRGNVAAGYQISGIRVDPPTITLSGSQAILNSLDTVGTEQIDVSGLSGSRSFTVGVRTPQGVSASPGQVTVRIIVTSLPTPPATPTATPLGTPTPTASP